MILHDLCNSKAVTPEQTNAAWDMEEGETVNSKIAVISMVVVVCLRSGLVGARREMGRFLLPPKPKYSKFRTSSAVLSRK
jgi:hypothetical protein